MKKRILSILLAVALVLCLAPLALADEAAALPFTVNAKGVPLTDIETIEAGYVPYAYDAAKGDMVPAEAVTVYCVTVPYSAETVDVTFTEERLAYNYMPGNVYIAGALANGQEFEGLCSFTVTVDANADGKPDYVQVQTPYDENWNSTTLYAITFQYEQPPFGASIDGLLLDDPLILQGGYTPYAYDAEKGDMVPAEPVPVFVLTVPFDAETVDLGFQDERLAYNYMPGNQYIEGALANGQEFEGLSFYTVKIDANKDGYMDFIQIQTPYDENWNSTTLYAITFKYADAEFTAAGGDGTTLDEPVVKPAAYVPYAYDAEKGDMVPVDAVPVYTVEIPLTAETVVLTFPEQRLAYNYMPGNQYLAGALGEGKEFEGLFSLTVQVDANEDGKPDYIQVQTPYDENWNSTTLYAITFAYPDPSDFYAYVDGKVAAAPEITKGAYTPYGYDAEKGDMVPVDPVFVYTFTVPFGTETVDLAFGEERLAYNYMPGNIYLAGALGEGKEFEGMKGFTMQVDANKDGAPDFIQVQTPYDENWNSTTLYAITFKYEPDFQDVPVGSWYYEAVAQALRTGLTNGTSDTTFSPEKTCTVAEILTFLWRAAGEPASETALPAGVAEDAFYAAALRWALEKELVAAEGFKADEPCTRAMAVSYMWKAAGKPAAAAAQPFADVAADADYAAAVAWAYEQGITKGVSETAFAPDTLCNRAHIVTFLARQK